MRLGFWKFRWNPILNAGNHRKFQTKEIFRILISTRLLIVLYSFGFLNRIPRLLSLHAVTKFNNTQTIFFSLRKYKLPLLFYCPWLCCHSFYNSTQKWSFWMEANLCRFFIVCLYYVLPLEMKLTRGGCWDPINFCACSKTKPRFPLSYVVVFFVFNELWWEVIDHFIDIGEIVDPKLLFLFPFHNQKL